jgi:hypothetical protein
MPFGKYRGMFVEDLPHDYLTWLRELPDLRDQLRCCGGRSQAVGRCGWEFYLQRTGRRRPGGLSAFPSYCAVIDWKNSGARFTRFSTLFRNRPKELVTHIDCGRLWDNYMVRDELWRQAGLSPWITAAGNACRFA